MPTIKDLNNGVKQHTAEEYDERFYIVEDEETEEKSYYPSVTHILSTSLPKSPYLIEWYGNKGYEEAGRIMDWKAHVGSYVHDCVEKIAQGESVEEKEIDIFFKNPKHALKVKRSLVGFLNWFEEEQPEILATEYHFVSEHNGMKFGGTIDVKCKLKSDDYKIVRVGDYKTSDSVFDSHKIQLSCYEQADKAEGAFILQLGNRTKRRYTMTLLKDSAEYFKKFEYALKYFNLENPNAAPRKEEFPEVFKIKA